MPNRLFGTDGIKGRANSWPITPGMALQLGQAAGRHFARDHGARTVLIGKDTRLSGYMIESALVAGFTSVGMDVLLTGPLPTPAVGMMTRSLRADLGIMISASHNPHQDNGIKFFGPDGYKLSDADEAAIETGIETEGELAEPGGIGRARRIQGTDERYIEFVKRAVPRSLRLDGLRIVVDAANGAAHRVAPKLIWELGAEVIPIGASPDGLNINAGCGSTSPQACAAAVLEHGADLGIALDGDADRVQLIDATGRLIDGDQLMSTIAERAHARGELARATLVATIMSNMGLERHLAGQGIGLARTRVGDRHVVEHMRATGCNIGGEQSGHIILSDLTTTGDGLVAALQAIAAVQEAGRPASEVLNRFEPLPQVTRNVSVERGRAPMEKPAVIRVIQQMTARLGSSGRLVVRPSGTEPLVRVMAEGEDPDMIHQVVDEVSDVMCREAMLAEGAAAQAEQLRTLM
ncbi:phosphoglucosamine mutase [Paracoccus sp. (in: a-proteobacteria)]|uniref:phosphoglucosamine mutase n=1 Tax=Paracoccus sp. TaxID=267 RepID=UPI0026E0CFBA|nr:phosphoglucosamine mutase [Paracoccus sp. (in: a-proteobacteria)]MDO5370585.1 phosphoglucosamine mutase [Paracoccus sp. (in: a-proteobacteria)]